jgi:gas vesicle protein
MQIPEFWIGTAIGAVLGFGAGAVLFLPIVLRQTDLEDNLDRRSQDVKRMIQTVERLRDKLDAMVLGRDVRILSSLKTEKNETTASDGSLKTKEKRNYGRG